MNLSGLTGDLGGRTSGLTTRSHDANNKVNLFNVRNNIKSLQDEVYYLTDQRKLVESKLNQLPTRLKNQGQRARQDELEGERAHLTKLISGKKYETKILQ